MYARNAANAYARVGIETGVQAANPVRLVVMLYDGALAAIAEAERALALQRTADKGKALSKAIAIIDSGLRGSLDLKSSPLAVQLEQLYEYMSRRLLVASVNGEQGGLQEVARLLTELRGAWIELADSTSRRAAAAHNERGVDSARVSA